MARRQRHTMTSVRWTCMAVSALVLAVTFLATDNITARFVAGYVVGIGMITLGGASVIIRSTRNNLETRLAEARQGKSIDR
jgi:hypothetical protein